MPSSGPTNPEKVYLSNIYDGNYLYEIDAVSAGHADYAYSLGEDSDDVIPKSLVTANTNVGYYVAVSNTDAMSSIQSRMTAGESVSGTFYQDGKIISTSSGNWIEYTLPTDEVESDITLASRAYVDKKTSDISSKLDLGKLSGTVPVAHGGTGATTAAQARTNLGIKEIATRDVIPVNAWDGIGNPMYNDQIVTCGALYHVASKVAAGSVQYLGTAKALTDLSTGAGKGDFYRASAAISSSGIHAGDLIVANVDDPKQEISEQGYAIVHAEGDKNTWTANSASADGYVPKGTGHNSQVYATNSSGAPAWRTISATQGSVTQGSVTITHPARTGSSTFTPSVKGNTSSFTPKSFGTHYYTTATTVNNVSIPAKTLVIGNENGTAFSYVSSVTASQQTISVSVAAAGNTTAATTGVAVGNPSITIS